MIAGQTEMYCKDKEVSSAYLLYDPESRKIVESGMVKFNEAALDKPGKVVTSWDLSVVAPPRTNFMVTALDGGYYDTPPGELGDGILEIGAYMPEGSDEILVVLKVQTEDDACWFPPEHTRLAAVGGKGVGDLTNVLPVGVTEPKGAKQAMEAPDVDEWMEAIQKELEALVAVKRALLMIDVQDVPPGVRLLDMSLVLKVKLDKHRQLQKRKQGEDLCEGQQAGVWC
ncbi:hypothetical protein CYMTET_56594 [Cymbomonas tetramitiformis]|uniref:Uncharacterized protein n=1 Tax=Cymbomonas tetramitiformis TaxID=36881 RepID=A0AAE0BBT4_9CHLO|nr:hypothetical protein CYMTET_56594 [Cymbomonas tetramitiformis]